MTIAEFQDLLNRDPRLFAALVLFFALPLWITVQFVLLRRATPRKDGAAPPPRAETEKPESILEIVLKLMLIAQALAALIAAIT